MSATVQLTVDVLDGLRLLWSGASDEARPLLKAAMLEIQRLRGTVKDERVFADFHRGDGTDDDRRFASPNETQHHDNTTA